MSGQRAKIFYSKKGRVELKRFEPVREIDRPGDGDVSSTNISISAGRPSSPPETMVAGP